MILPAVTILQANQTQQRNPQRSITPFDIESHEMNSAKPNFSRIEKPLQAYPEHHMQYDTCSKHVKALDQLRETFLSDNENQMTILEVFLCPAEALVSTAKNTKCELPVDKERIMIDYFKHQNDTLHRWGNESGIVTLRQVWIMCMFAEEFIRQTEEIFRNLFNDAGYGDFKIGRRCPEDEEWIRSLIETLKVDSAKWEEDQKKHPSRTLNMEAESLTGMAAANIDWIGHSESEDDGSTLSSTCPGPMPSFQPEDSDSPNSAWNPETQASDISSNGSDSSDLAGPAFQRARAILSTYHVTDRMPRFDSSYRRPNDLHTELC